MRILIELRLILVLGIIIGIVSIYSQYTFRNNRNKNSKNSRGRGGRGSKWWGIGSLGEPSNLLLNTIRSPSTTSRGSYVDPFILNLLRRKQERLLRENPGVVESVARGSSAAISECKYVFKEQRWNCPTKTFGRGRNIFGKIVEKGCRETSFIYALTSAALTHAVVRGCSDGTIESCSCDYRSPHLSYFNEKKEPSWKWGSCSDNIEFGLKFSKDFADAGEKGRDVRGAVNLHNNEAGRLNVQGLMRRQCKCHGMSGSCTMRTCWMRLPPMREIGRVLKEKYDGASRVLFSNSLRSSSKFLLKPLYPHHRPPSSKDLVFYEDSPSFCERDLRYGLAGTSGRSCNLTSMGVDGCDLMCCGRGYTTMLKTVTTRCNCTFKWCCEVQCQNCTSTIPHYTCK